jgi:hypothetical protein
MAMLMRTEHGRWNDMFVKELSMLAVFAVIGVAARWNDMLVKELLMLAVFAVIGVAAAVGLAIAFPKWFAQFPG